MRFRRLELAKFGSFTGENLEFLRSQPDFHVVFGPNEAGKSTTLRAIKGFLYGIPHVSQDVYLHSGGDLRISAELETKDGAQRFTRRKGRKATLLDASGESVPEEQLKALLQGVDGEVYAALFGLDHVSLREGGAALARGEGQLGESLYAAGIGSGGVREVLARLRLEAESLYLPRGKRTINQLVSAFQAAKAELRLATTEPQSWLMQREEVSRQQAEVERLSDRRSQLRLEESRLKQLQRLGHIAARHSAAQRELELLGGALELPQTFQEERERWMLQAASSEREARRRNVELVSARQELERLGAPSDLASELDVSELEYLDDALGSHRKAVIDLPRRRGELQAIEAEITHSMRGLDLTFDRGSDAQLPGPAVRAELAALIEDRTRLEVTLTAQRDELADLDARYSTLKARIASLPERPEPSALEHALEVAAEDVALEGRIAELRVEASGLAAENRHTREQLGVRSDAPLALPDPERVERFLEETARESQNLASRESESQRLELELDEMASRLAALEATGELLRPEELQDVRGVRERAWERVDDELRAARLPAPSVVREFEGSAREVDGFVDRLLADAERVSLGVQLRLGAQHARERLVESRERSQAAERRLNELNGTFVEQFSLFAGTLPEQVAQRFAALSRVQQAERRAATLNSEVERLNARLERRIAELRTRLGEFAEQKSHASLAELVKRGRALLTRLNLGAADLRADTQRLAELAERRAVRQRLLELAEAQHAEWAARWEQSLKRFKLPPETPSRVVNARIEALAQLERRLDKRSSLEGRIQGMERDARQLAQWLRERLARFAPDLLEWDVARAGAELKRRYHVEKAKAERCAELTERIERLGRELASSEQDSLEAASELARLCQVAGVEDPKELPVAERRAAEQHRLQGAIAERQRELLEEASGTWHDLPAILAAVGENTSAEIALRLSELESELGEIDESYRDAISDLERKRAGLERLSKGSAATRREEQEEVLATLRREVMRYRRVKLAELILAQEVERYRKENQGPILERANQLFPKLTLGRYRELSIGFDADDRAILEAIPSGASGEQERVRVDDLSDGARDQLFLALRIASIERYVDAGTVLPVVLDDILVHFDEERARAALEALSELGDRTQVLFFTHHRRHVELCEGALGGRFTLHELRRRAA
ncbi:MAG: AAA family ATPase [Polyangiaceae bacterium]|nr:AAA family ATPase [Polyangiaceae bacterium]